MEYTSPHLLGEGIYWVGSPTKINQLNCNPYLIIENNEGILIDPGSVLDFKDVFTSVTSLLPVENISHIILQHQDPDFCSAVPYFESNGFKGKVITFWRTAVLVKYYGIQSEYYLVNDHNFEFYFQSGRKLLFFLTPYLHFPGAIVTYDIRSETLFTSDLFGALTFKESISLFADDNYMEAMLTFHEHYMPGNEIMRPVMELLLKLDIKTIASQHGSIITNNPRKYIEALRDLECGSFLQPVRKSLRESGGYISIANILLKRCASIFPVQDVLELFHSTDITIDPNTMTIIDYNCVPEKLIDRYFTIIYNTKGFGWISALEIIAKKLSLEYSFPLPQIYQSAIVNFEKTSDELSRKNEQLEQINITLQQNLDESRKQLERCPITDLYNRVFFDQYLIQLEKERSPGTLLLIKVDNLQFISYTYGNSTGNETLKNIAYLLREIIADVSILFKLEGAMFACYCPSLLKASAVVLAEKLRLSISKSSVFIEPVTVTISVASFEELSERHSLQNEIAQWLFSVAEMRLFKGAESGNNVVISESSIDLNDHKQGLILIADSEPLHIDTLKKHFEKSQIEVISCNNGEQALSIIEKRFPDVVIAELMLPKIDGFMVREKMLTNSLRKNQLFILTSHVKTEQTIQQAMALDIFHYFKKPYFLIELLGLIRHHFKNKMVI
jgi:two-component system, cell cycle response regulator